LDPDLNPGNHPITDPDPDPTFELQIDKKQSKFGEILRNLDKYGFIWYIIGSLR